MKPIVNPKECFLQEVLSQKEINKKPPGEVIGSKKKKGKRIVFSLEERIRDHHDCPGYDECLETSAERNYKRVCYETCYSYIPPHKNEAFIIAEILENWIEPYLNNLENNIYKTYDEADDSTELDQSSLSDSDFIDLKRRLK